MTITVQFPSSHPVPPYFCRTGDFTLKNETTLEMKVSFLAEEVSTSCWMPRKHFEELLLYIQLALHHLLPAVREGMVPETDRRQHWELRRRHHVWAGTAQWLRGGNFLELTGLALRMSAVSIPMSACTHESAHRGKKLSINIAGFFEMGYSELSLENSYLGTAPESPLEPELK